MNKIKLVSTQENNLPLHKSPSNIQAEQKLLGAILINSDVLNYVSEFLKSEHFFEPLHQKIYKSIIISIEKGFIPTPITLLSMLDKESSFQELGGSDYLNRLAIFAVDVINPHDFGKIIFDFAKRRELIQLGLEIVNDAYEATLEYDSDQQIECAEAKLYNLATQGSSDKECADMRKHISNALDTLNMARKKPDHVTGLSSGLVDLDKKLCGFQNSDLVIIAGRPSMGKTAFALNLALNACGDLVAKHKGTDKPSSVGFLSLEMSSEQLTLRLLSKLTGIDSSEIRSGRINEEDYNLVRTKASELAEQHLLIDDTPALSIAAIRTKARKMKRKHNIDILFIDYLQLIHASSKKHENRTNEVSEITQGLKAIAKELNIPVIALSQLSRAVEQRDDKRPQLSDLRESGSIEQDADIVMFIYREEYYLSRKEPNPADQREHQEWREKRDKALNKLEIIIGKHRNGSIGTVPVFYNERISEICDKKFASK